MLPGVMTRGPNPTMETGRVLAFAGALDTSVVVVRSSWEKPSKHCSERTVVPMLR
jgi:hypothetical protein